MKRPTMKEVFGAVLFAVVVLWAVWVVWKTQNDCDQRNGVLVKTVVGYQCLRLVLK